MENLETASLPSPELDDFSTMRERVRGTNISETTLLATDYLNHFNEVVMMLDMVPSMPMFLDELQEWEPKSYQQHFRDASFSDAALAVEAYLHVPPKYREPFEEVVDLLDRFVDNAISRLAQTIAAEDEAATAAISKDHSTRLTKLIDLASAIIHGQEDVLGQAQIDDLFPEHA